MFAYIKGNLEVKTNGYVVIDVNGIGYKIFMSETAINKLGQIGEIVKIHTYVRVREDDISIFGFNTNEELRMFELLLSVSGIGAKSALVILSNVSVSSFALAIINNDVNLLKKLPGIGPKTAQRAILELKDKLKKENEIVANEDREVSDTIKAAIIDDEKIAEATAALKVLGYTGKEIEKALEKVDANLSVEDIIRKGLLNLAR
ncbi:holliday junction ATP-dependent DNA helicase RuvA [Clostridium sp. CAG:798]|jgi:Holliday junction DNA helicase RuvA|nr:holliday junction ATP-dependent DNA helicase RuvA [Clostridium sp. CAG:798]HBJ12520.1 Holliday junction branch migration protein RuvA [Clostridiales bacterium]